LARARWPHFRKAVTGISINRISDFRPSPAPTMLKRAERFGLASAINLRKLMRRKARSGNEAFRSGSLAAKSRISFRSRPRVRFVMSFCPVAGLGVRFVKPRCPMAKQAWFVLYGSGSAEIGGLDPENRPVRRCRVRFVKPTLPASCSDPVRFVSRIRRPNAMSGSFCNLGHGASGHRQRVRIVMRSSGCSAATGGFVL